MLKFAALEKKVKEKEEKERKMSNRATETSSPPSQVSFPDAHDIISYVIKLIKLELSDK